MNCLELYDVCTFARISILALRLYSDRTVSQRRSGKYGAASGIGPAFSKQYNYNIWNKQSCRHLVAYNVIICHVVDASQFVETSDANTLAGLGFFRGGDFGNTSERSDIEVTRIIIT